MDNKRFTNYSQFQSLHQHLQELKASYKYVAGRYTSFIKDINLNEFKNITYSISNKNPKVFIAYDMLLKDVKFNFIPELNEKKIKYHNTNLEEIYADKIHATDINSAYANILYNDTIISKKTFDYISKLPKGDRLACIGMLASKKNTYYFEEGKIKHIDKYENPYTKIFLYAVAKTYNIMLDVKKILGDDFLYSWVDCVYYHNKNKAHKIVNECLNDYHLRFKSIWCYDFEVIDKIYEYHITYNTGTIFDKPTKIIIPRLPNNRRIILTH